MLRPYQHRAFTAAMDWVRRCVDPCLIEAATGAGKSHVIAALANEIHGISGGKRVLCMAPSAELVIQNREKFLATGEPASIYSASAGGACLRHPVVFGTPGTVKKATDKLCQSIAAVVLDEAHGITPTVRRIIHELRRGNPNLRVIGLTATPYRLDSGYIFQVWPDGTTEEQAEEPYFARLVDRVTAHELIQQGYLTPPVLGGHEDEYEVSGLELGRNGRFTASSIDRAFVGKGRKTSKIVHDIVARAAGRRGVIIFAASVAHAHEVAESLPPELTAVLCGNIGKHERRTIIDRFKAGELKYLVNVEMLTTGFDAPHVDCVALLRHTESAGLMQQMIGRGLRLAGGKEDCLVLDYACNVDTHAPDGDIFNPQIMAPKRGSNTAGLIDAECESCGYGNRFSARQNPDDFHVDQHGYFVDLDGARILTEYGDMPAHHGRRCEGRYVRGGHQHRCGYRWTAKDCHECGEPNDIAARVCGECGAEIVDPNEKLRMEFARAKADPYTASTDRVRSWSVHESLSRAGNPIVRVTYHTDYGTPTVIYSPTSRARRAVMDWDMFNIHTHSGTVMPETLTYYKDRASGLWRAVAYDQPEDKCNAVP